MENVWVRAAVWVGLGLIATIVAMWLKTSTAAQRDCRRQPRGYSPFCFLPKWYFGPVLFTSSYNSYKGDSCRR